MIRRLIFPLLLAASLPVAAAQKYDIDQNHTKLTFSWDHLGFSNPSAALEKFSREIATRVQESGNEVALEPMPPADRKVVHDTVSAIDGVATISEGEEPRRRVVIRPV